MSKNVNHTRLFNDLQDFLDTVVDVTANFPKSHRFVLGARLQELAVEMIRLFAESYLSKSARSLALMDTLMADLETVKVIVSMAVRRKWIFGQSRCGHLVRLLASITKQSSALRNSFESVFSKDQSDT